MGVRGDFFTRFLERAADTLHASSRKLQVHLRHCHQEPKLSTEHNQLGFWAMPKVWASDWPRWVDLADEITLKDYHFNHYNPEIAAKIKQRARQAGKRVWVHCYISQGRELNVENVRRIEADADVGGVLLYEVCNSQTNEVDLGLIEQYGPIGFHEPVLTALNAVLADVKYQ